MSQLEAKMSQLEAKMSQLEADMSQLEADMSYSTLRAKTGKMDEPVNRELNVTRS